MVGCDFIFSFLQTLADDWRTDDLIYFVDGPTYISSSRLGMLPVYGYIYIFFLFGPVDLFLSMEGHMSS